MPRRSKTTAGEELAALRERYAAELGRSRELEVALERARLEVDGASRAITDGYASEDEQAVREAREREQSAVETVAELEGQLAGAVVRTERAGQRVDEFQTERARDLLVEAEHAARETTIELRRTAHETVRAWHQYKADRARIQEIVNRLEPGLGQVNGPASTAPASPLAGKSVAPAGERNREASPCGAGGLKASPGDGLPRVVQAGGGGAESGWWSSAPPLASRPGGKDHRATTLLHAPLLPDKKNRAVGDRCLENRC
jgi:hypothetical protein